MPWEIYVLVLVGDNRDFNWPFFKIPNEIRTLYSCTVFEILGSNINIRRFRAESF